MRKIAEIRKDLNAAIESVKTLDNNDVQAMEKASEEIRKFTTELNLANEAEAAEQRLADNQIDRAERIAGRRFSIAKFIREAAEGKLTGLEAEVAEMGSKEYERLGLSRKGFVIPSAVLRASAGQNYTTAADGGYAKETMAPRYIEGLKDRLVVAKLGATVLTDLVGTVPIVSAGAVSAAWKAEGAQATVSKATFAQVSLTPHRNAVVAAFSKDLLRQTSIDIEEIMMNKILDAHASLLESACIAGTGSNAQPTGVLNTTGIGSVAMGTNGAAISWASVVALETTVNALNANRGKLGYLTNAKVIGALKSAERNATNGIYMLDGQGNMINGYPIDWTNLVPSNLTKGTGTGLSAMIFGNWEDLYIGHWGGVDLVVDPYTLADYADVRVVLNSWDDCVVVEPKSFAAIKDIVA